MIQMQSSLAELTANELTKAPFVPSPDPDAVIRSVHLLAEGIVGLRALNPMDKHVRELLSILIWKLTEAHGKYSLRYRSLGALQKHAYPGPGKFIHEHVHTRKSLIGRMIGGDEPLTQVLADAVACLVTSVEDKLLRKVPNDLQGWDRYRNAGIAVFDMEEEAWLLPPTGKWQAQEEHI
jgi:hypothetical protein